MITTFEVEGFGCLKHVGLQLTPLHALIGPNDSGKSTILRAIADATGLASQGAPASHRAKFSFGVTGPNVKYSVAIAEGPVQLSISDGKRTASITRNPRGMSMAGDSSWAEPLVSKLGPATLVRFDPDALRRSSALLPDHDLKNFLTSRGIGLPGIYEYLLRQGDEVFTNIKSHACELFPTLRSMRLVVEDNALQLEFQLWDGTSVRAPAVSDGLLYYLAFAAVRHVFSSGTLLIEEPENGLHPARIRDVVRILRDFVEQNQAQVIMATHSPLVVNELKPDEVTVVTRTLEEGTKAVLIKDTPNFERRAKAAELGELWLSYADGESEAPLLGQARA